MPYQNDNRAPGLPMPQHQSLRHPSDRPGVGIPRPSPPHGHPQHMNPASFNRPEYHHQPPHRHFGNLPPHFSERSPRSYPPFGQTHGIAPHQGDEHVNQQYTAPRRAVQLPPSQSPRSNATPGPEGPPRIRGPALNHRRNPQYSYGQGFYDYGDYNRSLPSSESHSPLMRPLMRENESRRFVPRSIEIQDRQHNIPSEQRHRNMMGPADHPIRHPESWRGLERYDKEYIKDENILPPPQTQRNPPFRIEDRVFREPPRVGYKSFDELDRSRMTFQGPIPNSENNSEDEQPPSFRTNDEDNPEGRDHASNQIGCTCKKSKCLKLYCQCFASSMMCNASCRCIVCRNTPEFEVIRNEARRSILIRNPNAFDTKFKSTAEGKAKKAHKLGCKCRKSACLKKYCECYNANVKCHSNCRCVGCQNMPENDRPEGSDSNFVPTSMMNAARDLAGLKSISAGKITSDSMKASDIQSPPRASINQELYPVPALTASDTRSKEDDSSADGQVHLSRPGKQIIQNEISPTKSSVDVLLSAAYALTELQSAFHSPAKTSVENDSNIISPSPKRKLSELSFQASLPENAPSKRSQTTIIPRETENESNEKYLTS